MNKKALLMIPTAFILIFSALVAVAQQRPAAAGDRPPDMLIDRQTRTEVVENLARDLRENYVFPEVAERMAADIERRLREREYEGLTSAVGFAKKLTEDLQAISRDKHLRVRFSERPVPVRKERAEPTAEERAEHLNFMKRINYGFERVERLDGNIGYINLRGFVDAEAGGETVAAAMRLLAHTDALIFDLRENGGGDPQMVALISSYLFGDKPVHLNSLYWRRGDRTDEFWTKPEKAAHKFADREVYVLTSRRTFSAAEEFSYNLQNLKRAKIVGETTGGGAHPGGSFRLGRHFQVFISTGRAINPISKTNWEGTGVVPDIGVPKEQALITAHLMALETVRQKTDDERLKSALAGLIEKNRRELAEMKRTGAGPK